MTVQKTNAARLLDAAGISYTLVPYEVDEEHLEASHVAEQLGEDLDRVFKTLVLRGDRTGLFVCVVPGSMEVDLRVAARISGNKNCAMIHVKELLPLTGYVHGGCSPVGMKKQFPTVFHETVILFDTICVSAGKIGAQVEVAPDALMELIGAEAADLVVE
jgi:Cys-tRNA(Pro)/Cys-tRNA(Cys) deacylase